MSRESLPSFFTAVYHHRRKITEGKIIVLKVFLFKKVYTAFIFYNCLQKLQQRSIRNSRIHMALTYLMYSIANGNGNFHPGRLHKLPPSLLLLQRSVLSCKVFSPLSAFPFSIVSYVVYAYLVKKLADSSYFFFWVALLLPHLTTTNTFSRGGVF